MNHKKVQKGAMVVMPGCRQQYGTPSLALGYCERLGLAGSAERDAQIYSPYTMHSEACCYCEDFHSSLS